MICFVAAGLALLTLAPTSALAWGQTGHPVIGGIAQHRVSDWTAAEIALLIGPEGLAEASTFANEQRSNPAVFWQAEAGPYHFVTVPTGQTYATGKPPLEGDAVTALVQNWMFNAASAFPKSNHPFSGGLNYGAADDIYLAIDWLRTRLRQDQKTPERTNTLDVSP